MFGVISPIDSMRRQVLGQGLPLPSGPQDVENPIQHIAHIARASPPAMSRRRNHGLRNRPLGIGRILLEAGDRSMLMADRSAYLNVHTGNPKPFVWTKTVAKIFSKVSRAKPALESRQ
jgi:hypothetical protein